MEEIPRPAWEGLDDLAQGKRPLSVAEHLLAVIEEGADRLDRLLGSLRYKVRKERFKENERAGKVDSDKVVDRLHDALDRLEALAAGELTAR